MELFSNLAWLFVCLLMLGTVVSQIRRGKLRISTPLALMTVFTLAMILLPVISMTDDLLDNSQAALPPAAQTWHLATGASSVGVEPFAVFSACLLFLMAALTLQIPVDRRIDGDARPYTTWLTRAQRLRPPPVTAH